MEVSARIATHADIPELIRLYGLLEREMSDLSYLWIAADGLQPPVEDAMADLLTRDDTAVLVGLIDDLPFGFMVGRVEALLDRSSVGAIRMVFTQEEARAVGIGSAMRDLMIEFFEGRGVDRLDAHVLPGHRLAKNFFEAGGFSARHIVMHRKP